jgi:putative tryptophan/tyrosine transport system substrate-binding protein
VRSLSLSRPGGNATGFMLHEYSLSGKWLELLKEIAPKVTRAAVLRDVGIVAGIGQFAVIQSVAPSLGVEVSPINVRDAADIERAIAAFARSNSNGALIVPASALALTHRVLIITLAARHNLPVIYFTRPFVVSGGLISYGSDPADQYRRAASYVDRILRGEKPGDLPVQAPTKYDLIINLKTVALGKARERRIRDESVKPLKEVQLVKVQPGQSRSGQAGSECCLSPGDWRVRSVHSKEAGREGSAPTSDMIATPTPSV